MSIRFYDNRSKEFVSLEELRSEYELSKKSGEEVNEDFNSWLLELVSKDELIPIR